MVTPCSAELCAELSRRAAAFEALVPLPPLRYPEGHRFDLPITWAWPELEGQAELVVERFVGGGFAGQVYRCRLERLDVPGLPADAGLTIGGRYAVKILVPPSSLARSFRNAVYWMAFQAPFSQQVNADAFRTGLLWPKLVRVACREIFDCDDAVADVYASFHDARFEAYGEIREWVEGRTWRLEVDDHLRARRAWRTVAPEETDSPEYVAKKQFMVRFVALLRDMGGGELSRQYAWWTMKSQPNCLKREGRDDAGPAEGLCAVDFRAGLALVPWLPMSPGDLMLILRGLREGRIAQFDRCDIARLRAYVAAHAETFAGQEGMIEALIASEQAYRRSMPDIFRQGVRLLTDGALRRDVRRGLVEGYRARHQASGAFADGLVAGRRFGRFYLLGAIPLLGRRLRALWGHAPYRAHVARWWREGDYRRGILASRAQQALVLWHRNGRTGERRSRYLAERPLRFWFERFTLGLLPRGLHRLLTDPGHAWRGIREGWTFLCRFYREAEFRIDWLTQQVEEGAREGMLDPVSRDAILSQVRDPFIAKYLKCLAVHFATLPITQIVSVIVGGVIAGVMLAHGSTGAVATGAFLFTLVVFQLTPISPGSLCRGGYVVYRMCKERNTRDYLIAAPLSFVKYIGYLAFPIQMVTTYPALAQFMASRWATQAVHMVPVFGEKGALFEHAIFDLFFNVSRAFGRRARRHARGLLDLWLLLGMGLFGLLLWRGIDWSVLRAGLEGSMNQAAAGEVKSLVNGGLACLCVFLLPRLLFYPLLTRQRRDP